MGRARGDHHAATPTGSGSTPRGPYKWTEAHTEKELRAFLGDRPDWPTSEEFRAAGRHQLLQVVGRTGGASRWAPKLGRVLRPGQDRSAYPLEASVAEARALVSEHGRLPNQKRLVELGHGRLARVVEVAGGARAFSRTHDL